MQVFSPSNKFHTVTNKTIHVKLFNESNGNITIFFVGDTLNNVSSEEKLSPAHSVKNLREEKNNNSDIVQDKSLKSILHIDEDTLEHAIVSKYSKNVFLEKNTTTTTMPLKNNINHSKDFNMTLTLPTHARVVISKEGTLSTHRNQSWSTTNLNQTHAVGPSYGRSQGDGESKHNLTETLKILMPINYTAGNLPEEYLKLLSNNSIHDFNGEWETQPARTSDISSLLNTLSINWLKFFVLNTSLKVSINTMTYPLHIKITPNLFFSRTFEVYVKFKDAAYDSFTSVFTGVWKTQSVYKDGRLVTEAFSESIGKMVLIAGVLRTDPQKEYNSRILLVRVTVEANKIKSQDSNDSQLSEGYFWLIPKS
ncbi:uncharacterized protein LOC128882634 isoform X1 [Hylaeus volcanicus]|uniref:uncharacterized protein LOC128882634 isoform X1 n=1 Tax=Hylaeus volcanicus TaxID=313075 RepID=UPI0023B85BBD|nr:uncharacterized protein LOC128882634 isoform X1 [Hylaeus volcanicus]